VPIFGPRIKGTDGRNGSDLFPELPAHPVQIVGYEAGTPESPGALRLANGDEPRSRRLEPGTRLDYGLKTRHCAGSVDDEHVPCDRDRAPYCALHADDWPCARCRGNCELPLESCHEEHVVYLAAFEPATFKVGVTRSWRLEQRLGEQGARRGAHVRTVDDGRIARQIEADMAAEIPDRVEVDAKIAGLARELDETAWEALLEQHDVLDTHEFDYGLDLDHRPVAATTVTGRVRGTRGRVLVLEEGATTYAVDLRSLLGYEVSDGGSGPDRQSSLRAFDGSESG
jgi:hypothetical protein